MSNALKQWMQTTSAQTHARLARLAKTTVGTLRQIAGGYRNNGKASTTPELARRIEKATITIENEAGPRRVLREELCSACARCDLAKIAREVTK